MAAIAPRIVSSLNGEKTGKKSKGQRGGMGKRPFHVEENLPNNPSGVPFLLIAGDGPHGYLL
jgi:hypothetical protein